MSHHKRLKLVERKVLTPDRLVCILPDWLQPADYVALVASPNEKIIVPRSYMALQKDGSVKWHG